MEACLFCGIVAGNVPAQIVDSDERTAAVIQLFEAADDVSAAEGAFDAMDPADTPGTRTSVDRCEIKAELS
jgi:hypothetical protein